MNTTELQKTKQRYNIVGNSDGLNRALDVALQVAPTDLSVLIIGESGVGKEIIPRVIHDNSPRRREKYFAINCGSIPEGTIDSELFGHEKGSFTGAIGDSEGYFGIANKGTIFLDEVGELPLATQARLLRVLETGEYIRVGGQEIRKTDVRIVAATNVNMQKAVSEGKFREDLYYRLNTVQIDMPPLRERKGDIHLLFRKFARDFAEKYRMPEIELTEDAIRYLETYPFPGNIRQLRNLVEQITVVESERRISTQKLMEFIPTNHQLPSIANRPKNSMGTDFNSEREIMYKILFDMKNDLNDLKALTSELIKNRDNNTFSNQEKDLISRIYTNDQNINPNSLLYFEQPPIQTPTIITPIDDEYDKNFTTVDIDIEDHQNDNSLSLVNNEKELIIKALEKHNGRRNKAADELGISQRTLYRKIKQFDLE